MQCWVSGEQCQHLAPIGYTLPLGAKPKAWHPSLSAGDDKFHAKTSPLLIGLIENVLMTTFT